MKIVDTPGPIRIQPVECHLDGIGQDPVTSGNIIRGNSTPTTAGE